VGFRQILGSRRSALEENDDGRQVLAAFAVSLAMILVSALIAFFSQDFVLPMNWVINATRDAAKCPIQLR